MFAFMAAIGQHTATYHSKRAFAATKL
jgi:hypothetical protein